MTASELFNVLLFTVYRLVAIEILLVELFEVRFVELLDYNLEEFTL